MSIIEVEGLRKAYGGRPVVDDVSFAVDEGEIFGVLGPNGAGKTTTVECVEGLRVPDAGKVRVAGLDPVADHDRVTLLLGAQLQRLVAKGTSNREIAAGLFISEATVKTHLTHIYGKLGVKDRAAAVAVGYECGILG